MQWDVEAFPNVTEITSLEEGRVSFLARPAGQGKNSPVLCFAEEQTLLSLDSKKTKMEKNAQQKRRRIIDKLCKALEAFSQPFPPHFNTLLTKTSWGAHLVKN